MNIYTIYAPFLLLYVFCLCLSVFADFIFTSSSTCNWKMLRGHVDQGSLQRRPKMTQQRQNPQPKLKHQRSTKRSGVGADGPGWTDPTTGYLWGPPRPMLGGARSCVLGATAVRPVLPGILPFSSRLFVFLRVFALFCRLYNSMYMDLFNSQFTPIHSPFISINIRVVFRERKRERRRTARILDRVLWSKDGSMVLDEQILSLVLSFLNLALYFVIFAWIL